VLNLMKQRRRTARLSDAAMDALAHEAVALSDRSTARIEALDDCLDRLNAADRELIHDRYYFQQAPKQIAERRSRSQDSVYRALSRIHNLLQQCVERSLAREDG
jgi:RNA polymerase sigma-70 factor, ECF subfamily